ncbi:MAG: hypothetical protein AB2A00_11840 [Myxococcota bacterium]
MGLLDGLFGGGEKKKVEGLVAKVKQAYAQPEVRQEAMESLFKLGTQEAFKGVLQRFTYVCQSLHWDGVEKKWLVDELAKTGEPVLGPLKDFIHHDDNVNLAVRALEKMVPEADAQATLISALTARAPDDYRKTGAKLELIDHLGTRPVSPELWKAVEPYLQDHSDDVRAKVLEVIEGWKHGEAGAAVAALLADDTLSARVHRQAAQTLCALGVKLSPAPTLPPAAAEDYAVDGDGQVVRKKPAK